MFGQLLIRVAILFVACVHTSKELSNNFGKAFFKTSKIVIDVRPVVYVISVRVTCSTAICMNNIKYTLNVDVCRT